MTRIRRFVQQFSEVSGGDLSVGDMMEGVQALIYFPLDMPSVLLGGHGSKDDPEIYRNVQGVRCSTTADRHTSPSLTASPVHGHVPHGAEQRCAGCRPVCEPVCQHRAQQLQTRYPPPPALLLQTPLPPLPRQVVNMQQACPPSSLMAYST